MAKVHIQETLLGLPKQFDDLFELFLTNKMLFFSNKEDHAYMNLKPFSIVPDQ